jgi:hypothetical protein
MSHDHWHGGEWVVTPETTYVLIGWHDHYRRIFTDGRDWPAEIVPTYSGYSIGRWIDEDGDGQYDVLEVETRGFKGPRAYEETGLPLHVDNTRTRLDRYSRGRHRGVGAAGQGRESAEHGAR